MDYSRLDPVRRSVTPIQLDLVEAFANGRITRRQFIKRASVIGLSLSSVTAVIAACSGGTPSAAPASPGASASAGASPSASAAVTGGTIRCAIQRPVSVDPVGMQDLGGYGIVAQSFEFLMGQSTDPNNPGALSPALAAEAPVPNDDGTVWTFKLNPNAKWQHDGSPLTADDVVATMERLVAAGNSGLKGVLDPGGAVATDANTVTFTLVGANGNFPYLVSIYNAQTVITPKDYVAGTTFDGRPTGTGPWKLVNYNQQTGATFERNPDWWGGQTPLDGTEFIFFDETGPMITAYQGDQVDAIVQFDVLTGAALFNDPNFTLIAQPAALHRQIWMRVDKGAFADVKVREALALTWDRPALIQQLFQGRAQIGNDHVIWEGYPYFDAAAVPQRERNVDRAKQLLSEAGAADLTATLHAGELQEIPDLAVLLKSQAAEAGITLNVEVESLNTFYGAAWCPAEPADPPCSGAADLGIVDYGHRATPDVYLNAALKSKGIWNSSQYASAEFDAAFTEFQAAVAVDAQKAACTKIETILNRDIPVGLPYFYNYLAGNSNRFTGVFSSALGQMSFATTSQVA
ncbi:MAG TPA: ABC transporter substrate-binding protein [Candidatus Limnocylindrales bacterium]|jgi:peptide/nickel transport system substrate-binding protein|nr:ABC transporter substrate-binding protein [Candidatus Limnocylindrales bacterium]